MHSKADARIPDVMLPLLDRASFWNAGRPRIVGREAAELFRAHCRTCMKRRERMTSATLRTYEGYVRNESAE